MYNSKSESCGLWVIMMCLCRFVDYSKCASLAWGVDSGGPWRSSGEDSALPLQGAKFTSVQELRSLQRPKKKKNQRRTPLLKSARSQVLIPMCKTFYDLSLSLCHTHAHTHTSLSSLISCPTPPPGIVWSGSSHSSCVLAWWARPSLSLICLGKPNPSLRFQVTYTCSVEPSRQK